MKLVLVPVLLLLACLFAGTYGAVHNQISYTVSPEYFTEFKFDQFGILRSIPPRIGAAMVGWHAAWWMGILIGGVLIPLGLMIPGNAAYFWAMIRTFGVVAATTLLFGLLALGAAFILVDPDAVGQISRYDNEIVDDVAFARAGTMHNFSYLGGVVGILAGGCYLFWLRKQIRNQTSLSS